VSNNHTIHQLITDIQSLRERQREDRSDRATAYVVAYLLANRPFIEACLSVVKEHTTETDRARLQAENPMRFSASAIPDSFWNVIAYGALNDASTYYIHLVDTIGDDELHMLRRALEYASHCDQLKRDFRLLLSPA
jgi:hypothetical protein